MPAFQKRRGCNRGQMERMTTYNPGRSPPPVRIPTVFIAVSPDPILDDGSDRPIVPGRIVLRPGQLDEAVGRDPLGGTVAVPDLDGEAQRVPRRGHAIERDGHLEHAIERGDHALGRAARRTLND